MSTVAYNDTSSVFAYSGAWAATSWSAAPQSGTVHMTSDQTASISFTFPVIATAFSLYGIRQASGGLYNICIDCAPGAPYDSLVDGIAAPGVGPTPPGVLYQQTFPTPGIHTVVLHVQADGRGSPSGNSILAFTGFVLNTPASLIITLNNTNCGSTASGPPAAQLTVSAARSSASVPSLASAAEASARSSASPAATGAGVPLPGTTAPSGITQSSSRTTLLTRTTASTTGTTTAATTSTTASALTPTTPAALTSTPIPAPPHTGPIIAGALGAVALLCIFTFLVCWRRRHPRLRVTPYSSRWGSGGASLGLGGATGAGGSANSAHSTRSESSGKGKIMDGAPVSRAVDEDAPPPPPAYGTRTR